ncbi:MAG: hypothetical protein JKY56_09625 [Kofleriaceae bacterium]|nr:hypothetical protein [Kofleriaceae bacterium]
MPNAFRTSLRRQLAIMIAAVPLVYTGQAIADSPRRAGVFLGYSFSDHQFDWGIEIQTFGFDSCIDCDQEALVGPVARLSFRDLSPHLSVSMMLASELSGSSDSPSIGVEVGAVVALSNQFSLDFLSGVYQKKYGATVYAQQSWLEGHYPMGAGLHTSISGGSDAESGGLPPVDGRAFRGASGLRQRAWSPIGESTKLGQHWQSRALDECASIPAFVQLAAELLDLGAPNSLVRAALDAADDELRHTRMATYLARRFGSPDTNPTPPTYRQRPVLPRREQLRRLAKESWLDGCLGESTAAAIAGAEASKSNDQELQLIQSRIHQDENAHASLAWDVLTWVLSEDRSIAPIVRAERLREFSASASMVLSREESQDVLRHTHRQCRDRLHALT